MAHANRPEKESFDEVFNAAVSDKDITTAKSLVFRFAREIDVNYQSPLFGFTALMNACNNNDLTMARLLLDCFGSRVDINVQDSKGTTALMFAVRAKSLPLVKLIVESFRTKIDVNLTDHNGNTAVLLAYSLDCEQILAYICLHFRDTIDLNVVNNDGLSLLENACANGYLSLLTAVVDSCSAKIDIHVPTHTGRSLLQIARDKEQKAIVLYLLQQFSHRTTALSQNADVDIIQYSPQRTLAHVSVPARRASFGLSVAESRQRCLSSHNAAEKRKRGWAVDDSDEEGEGDALTQAFSATHNPDTPAANPRTQLQPQRSTNEILSPLHVSATSKYSPKRVRVENESTATAHTITGEHTELDSDALAQSHAPFTHTQPEICPRTEVDTNREASLLSGLRPHSTPSRITQAHIIQQAHVLFPVEEESAKLSRSVALCDEEKAQLRDNERALSAWKSRNMYTPHRTPGQNGDRLSLRMGSYDEVKSVTKRERDELKRLRALLELRQREKTIHYTELSEEREKTTKLTKELEEREEELIALNEELMRTRERERELDIALGNTDVQALSDESECDRFLDAIDRLRAQVVQRKSELATQEKRRSMKLSRDDKQCIIS